MLDPRISALEEDLDEVESSEDEDEEEEKVKKHITHRNSATKNKQTQWQKSFAVSVWSAGFS